MTALIDDSVSNFGFGLQVPNFTTLIRITILFLLFSVKINCHFLTVNIC